MGDDLLQMPVQYLRGVGPARAAALAGLNIATVGDLLEHLPFRYELRPKSIPIGHLRADETATIVGAIRGVHTSRGRSQASITADIEDGTGRCRVRWFNATYVRDCIAVGDVIRVTGKVEDGDGIGCFVNPTFRVLAQDEDPFGEDRDVHVPVYPATGTLNSAAIGRMVAQAVARGLSQVVESLPRGLRERRRLPLRKTALARVHAPTCLEDIPIARNRLAYDELLLMQLAVQQRRRKLRGLRDAPRLVATAVVDQRIRARLPFALTEAQDRAVGEIVHDLASDQPMARLLQGDVGSGKTAVAVYAALTAIANRAQVAMLLPTEILARQTHDRFEQYLVKSRVRTALLVGGMPRKQRGGLLRAVAEGEIDLLVGTHALIEGDVAFRKLGLVIVDEQHRFGVMQRERLRQKGLTPHYLVMTATPIPRTLAMTFYGDLDVSTIDTLPPGRQPIETRIVGPPTRERAAAWAFVRARLGAGERAYIVYPLVEESDALALKAATAEVETLRSGVLAGFNVGLLHGRMSSEEKADVVARFREGGLHALASTTVIEVGVDVPAATVMVIEHAERYGLSQLHQLRGRIGRGERQSYCLLFADQPSPQSAKRLEVIRATCDGFKIAEADLALRGPGELVGTRQHGLPAFKAADLVRDLELLRHARQDAHDLLRADPDLAQPEHAVLRSALRARFSQTAPQHQSGRPTVSNVG
jgi:ATP-dependent DNA helicase RecG